MHNNAPQHSKFRRFLIIQTLILCSLFVVGTVTTTIFLHRVNYYHSVKIEFTNLSGNSNIRVTGITPFGRRVVFGKNQTTGCFESVENSYFNEITIEGSWGNSLTATIYYRKNILTINNIPACDNENTGFRLTGIYKPAHKPVELLFSLFSSTGILKMLPFIILLIVSGLLISIFLLVYCRQTEKCKERVFFMRSNVESGSPLGKQKHTLIIIARRIIAVVLLAGLSAQLIGWAVHGYSSLGFWTGILWWAIIWWIAALILRKRPAKWRIVVNSVCITLMLVEMVLRLAGTVATYSEAQWGIYISPYSAAKEHGFEKKRNVGTYRLECAEYSYPRKANSLGYGDKEWLNDEMQNKTRIVCLGDSFTEGGGTPADSTWPKCLERILADSSYYFMNGGISGSDPVFEAYKLRYTFEVFHPDMVILCINYSDIDEIIVRGGFERFTPNGVLFKKAPWWEPVYASNHVFRLFFTMRYTPFLVKKSSYAHEQHLAVEIIHQAIDSIMAEAKHCGFQPVFVFHPMRNEVEKNYNEYSRLIKDLVEENIAVANLYSYYQHPAIKNEINTYYWPNDGHHNSRGYLVNP